MKKLKILHVITTLERGGAQRILLEIIKNKKRTINFFIICLSSETDFGKNFRKQGIDIFFLNGKNILEAPKVFYKFLKISRRIKPDIINSWLYHSDLFSSLAKILTLNTTPLVWSVHHASKNLQGESFHTKITLIILRILSNFIPDKIIYCSETAKKVHDKFGFPKKKSIVINNSVNSKIFISNKNYRSEFRNKFHLKDSDICIGLIARNDPNKGIDMFFKLIRDLNKNNKFFFKFIICGEKMDHINLNTFLKNLPKENLDKIIILGEIKRPEKILNAIDILVCPSITESFGLIALESILCGTPVVVSNIRAFKMVLQNYFLVNSYTSKSFKEKIIFLLEQPKEVLKKELEISKKNTINNFSLKTMLQEYLNVYKDLKQ